MAYIAATKTAIEAIEAIEEKEVQAQAQAEAEAKAQAQAAQTTQAAESIMTSIPEQEQKKEKGQEETATITPTTPEPKAQLEGKHAGNDNDEEEIAAEKVTVNASYQAAVSFIKTAKHSRQYWDYSFEKNRKTACSDDWRTKRPGTDQTPSGDDSWMNKPIGEK